MVQPFSNRSDASLMVSAIPAFEDNYIWAIQLPDAPAQVAIVDPGQAQPVLEWLAANQLQLAAILVTHHHHDHVGGIAELLAANPTNIIPVFGPDNPKISTITHPLRDHKKVELSGLQLAVIATPGHTLDHISYVGQGALFCGDTLFVGGCGRMFEGTPAQFTESLQRLAELPAATKVYCAHEYTAANLRFAAAAEPGNTFIKTLQTRVAGMRAEGKITVPSTLAQEQQSNPFLRAVQPQWADYFRDLAPAEVAMDSAAARFAWLRNWKDNF